MATEGRIGIRPPEEAQTTITLNAARGDYAFKTLELSVGGGDETTPVAVESGSEDIGGGSIGIPRHDLELINDDPSGRG